MSRPTCSPFRASSARWCARASRGVAHEIDARADRFFDVCRQSAPARHNRRSRGYFRGVPKCSDPTGIGIVQSAQGKAVSGVLSFIFATRFALYAVTLSRPGTLRQRLKYWDMMRRACERGSRCSTTDAPARPPDRSTSRRMGLEPQRCTTSIACTGATRYRRTPQQPSTRLPSHCGEECRARRSTRSVPAHRDDTGLKRQAVQSTAPTGRDCAIGARERRHPLLKAC